MNFYKYRGKRIRASDKSLVFRFFTIILSVIFILLLIVFNVKQIVQISWENISLFSVRGLSFSFMIYNILTIVLSISICIVVAFLCYYYQYDRVKQLIHRQKLTKMILENKWYESETIKDNGFFKDLNVNKQKEKIVYFPKMYYKLNEGLIYIQVEITLGKYQDQLLNLEKKLESGLYCELVSKELKDSYIEYVLLYDTIANRISINDVKVKHGSLKLMKSVYWEFDKLAHVLIAGGTGGGKTYFILTIIEALLNTNSVLYVLDPKNADLADLKAVMPNVYYKKDDMILCINNFYDEMMKRS